MIRNFTPHEVTINGLVFPSEGNARVEQQDILLGEHEGVEIRRAEYGKVEGLPMMEQDIYLIVSILVKLALPGRPDLLSPGGLIRDGAGRIIGASYLLV